MGGRLRGPPAGSPFFRLVPVGAQKRLWINRGHRFYSQVYAGPDSNEGTRSQWEVVLFTLGDCEISASEELAEFYASERIEWSRRLMVTLSELRTSFRPPSLMTTRSAPPSPINQRHHVSVPADRRYQPYPPCHLEETP